MPELLAPRIHVAETPAAARGIQGVSTSVYAIAGVFEKGPVAQPTFVAGVNEAHRLFGRPIATGQGMRALELYFAQGGQRAYVTRIAHYSDPAKPTTLTAKKACGTINDQTPDTSTRAMGSIQILKGSMPPWTAATGSITLKQLPTEKEAIVTVNAVPFPLPVIDNDFEEDHSSFAPTRGEKQSPAITAAALKKGINASKNPRIQGVLTASIHAKTPTQITVTALTPGKSGNAITLACDQPKIMELSGKTLTAGQDGTAITVGEKTLRCGMDFTCGKTPTETADKLAKALNRLCTETIQAQVETLSSATLVQMQALQPGKQGNRIALAVHPTKAVKLSGKTLTGGKDGDAHPSFIVHAADGPGTHANGRIIRIGRAGNHQRDLFSLTVLQDNTILDHFDNLSLDPAHPHFIHTHVNGRGARLIEVRVDSGREKSTGVLPPALGDHTLSGGNDGLRGLTNTDFIGDETAGTGLYSWKSIEGRFALASIPDRPTPAVQRAALLLCEKQRHFHYLIDLPAHLSPQEAVAYKREHNLHGNHAPVFYPALNLPHTSTLQGEISNTAALAGAMARTDLLKGVAKVAAGIEDGRLLGVTGLKNDATQQQSVRDFLYQAGINSLWVKPGVGVFNDGALLSQPNGFVRFINQRRVLIYIESSLKEGLRFVLHENICERLYHRINATITTFLTRVWQQGGLRGNTADDAFFVDTSHGPGTLNSPESEDEGQVNVRIGLATLKPAQFVNVTLTLTQQGVVDIT